MKHTRGSSRLLSLLLAVAMVAGLFAGLTLTASAADADVVWEDGKVIGEDLTLDGSAYTAENPLTVQVQGTVTVNATVYFTGYVKLVGTDGARILRGSDLADAKVRTLHGNDANLKEVTLENLTIDGGGVAIGQQLTIFSKGNLTVRNVRYVNGYSTSSVATMLTFSNTTGTCLVENCTFENNNLQNDPTSKSKMLNISDGSATDMNVRISGTTFRNNGGSTAINWLKKAKVTIASGNVFDCAAADYGINCGVMPTFELTGADDMTFKSMFRFGTTVGYLFYDEAAAAWTWSKDPPAGSLTVTSKATGVNTSTSTQANIGYRIHQPGETVRFDVTPAQNSNKKYYVSKVTMAPAAGGDETELTKDSEGYYSFTMPDYSVVITLTTENKPLHTITLVQPEHGTLSIFSPSNGQAFEGQSVSIDETADDGYVLQSLTWQAEGGEPVPITGTSMTTSGGVRYHKQFYMPAQDVTVTAVYGKTPLTLTTEATEAGLSLALTGERVPEAGAAGTVRIVDGVLLLDASDASTTGTTLTAVLNGNSLMSIADADGISAVKLLTPLGDLRLDRAQLEQLNRLRQSSLTLRLSRETETDASVLTGGKLSGTAKAAYTLELLGADGKTLPIGGLEAAITLRNVAEPNADLWQAGSATVRRCTAAVNGSTVDFTASVPASYIFGTLTPDANMPPVSADGYYEIATAAQLAWAAQNATGANLRLTADINVDDAADWQPFAAFSGHFDGGSHTVSGAISNTNTGGLFLTATNAVIENLTVDGTVTSSGAYGVAAIVGTADGCTVRNCTSRAKIVLSGHSLGVAGIVGQTAEKSTATTTISGCINESSISTDRSCAGGILGLGKSPVVLENCWNKASHRLSGGAGIAGSIQDTAVITGCVNTGAIASDLQSAGIVGYFEGTSLMVSDCYNMGKLDGLRGAGGATGYGAGVLAQAAGKGTVTISNCYNTGAISCHRLGTSGDYSSDIERYNLGQIVDTAAETVKLTVTNCYYQAITPVPADGAVAYGESKTAEELKSAAMLTALGQAFCADDGIPVNDGYPILTWQYQPCLHAETELQNALDPTCTAPGYSGDTVCKVCGKTVSTGTELPAAGHTEVTDAEIPATCTEAGKTAGSHCSVCNEVIVAQQEIPAKGHTEVADAAVEPTCTEAGKTAGSHCSVCSEVIVAQQEVPAKGHTEVVDAAVPATCTEAGKTEGSHCSVCNEVIVAQTEVAALGHDYVETARVDATESAAGSVTYTCSRCHDSYTETLAEIACPSAAYTDVPAYGNWAHAGIDYCVANGLMNGMSANRFDPKGTLTRAQLVTILYRVAGQPAVTTSGTFTDLTANWYKNAVEWAAANGVVKGYPDGTFRPDEAITREQIATILYRFDEASKAEEDKLAGFPDAADVSGWAAEGLNWAVNEGLINGVASQGTSYLQPKATATRDQIAAIIMRYLNSK